MEKIVPKNLQLGTELQKYTEETENYREFLKLCNEVVRLNGADMQTQANPEIKDNAELEELKKIKESLHEEIQKEVDRITSLVFNNRDNLDHIDLESTEMHIRLLCTAWAVLCLRNCLTQIRDIEAGRSLAKGDVFEFVEYRG